MAEKGDFPECEKCTSFQCVTCGLEASRGEGYITARKNVFKYCIYSILVLIALYTLHLDKMSFGKMIFLICFPVSCMYLITRTQISIIFIYLLMMAMSVSYFLFN